MLLCLHDSYQLNECEVGMKRKTMIIMMMIKGNWKIFEENGDRKLIGFLAPSVHLVHQVCLVLCCWIFEIYNMNEKSI